MLILFSGSDVATPSWTSDGTAGISSCLFLFLDGSNHRLKGASSPQRAVKPAGKAVDSSHVA
jgi:hypothetical protein